MRPNSFSQVVGQAAVVQRLQISMAAAKREDRVLGHVLLDGPPGLGKTTLARCVAAEFYSPFIEASGPMLDKPDRLLPLLERISERAILYIDEIHGVARPAQDTLLTVMEDFRIGEATLPRFTLIGTTTHAGLLAAPLRERFKIRCQLKWYSTLELIVILKTQFDFAHDAAKAIAGASRGTPRTAVRHAEWVRDWCLAHHREATYDTVRAALSAIGVSDDGLTSQDHRYLSILRDQFRGGPAGVNALSAALDIPKQTIEDEIEPYLLRQGLIARVPRGRKLVA